LLRQRLFSGSFCPELSFSILKLAKEKTSMNQLKKVELADASDRLTYALAQMSDFQELIRFFDTKVGAAVTIASALLTILFAGYGSVLDRLRNGQNIGHLWLAAISLLFSVLFFVSFMMMVYFAFLTLIPRSGKAEGVRMRRLARMQKGLRGLVTKPTFRLGAKSDNPVAFFGHVYALGEKSKGKEFVQEVSNLSLSELVQHVLWQNYLLSEILVEKFAAQTLCFRWLRLALMFWLAAQLGVLLIS
jgi:hypothetical protein